MNNARRSRALTKHSSRRNAAIVFALAQSLAAGALAQSKATIATSAVRVAPLTEATVLTAKPIKLPAFCPPPDGTRPEPTLVNTDAFVLKRFPLARVYKQLIDLSGLAAPSVTELYQQMWDALDKSGNAKFAGPHCDDNASTINGFPIDCPRPETVLKDTLPESFTPVALFNRFDLTPSDGSICGEYRIVYAFGGAVGGGDPYPGGPKLPTPLPIEVIQPIKTTSATLASTSAVVATSRIVPTRPLPVPITVNGRNFIIFEGILPNPDPTCGVEACRPVVEFWEKLASFDPGTAAGQTALADGLENFYFNGLSGFEPVVHPNHYGVKGGGGYGQRSGGQIRTNMFIQNQEWQLREFHLRPNCDKTGKCSKLLLDPVTVKTNPHHELFNLAAFAPDPRAPAFQAAFPSEAQALATDSVAKIGMNIADQFNAGQSTSQDFNEDYGFQFSLGSPPNPFSAAIDSELVSIARTDLTATDIVNRATTQSCAGCHQLSNGKPLGGKVNPQWPFSRGFVHVDEASNLSQALWCVFLPDRKTVLDGFFSSPDVECGPRDLPLKPIVILPPQERIETVPDVAPAILSVSGKIVGPN
ncbi:MAG: hypothetical protein RL701_4652 [Pseudomonadota bacterium]